jgi:HK97 family phage major capsid protein
MPPVYDSLIDRTDAGPLIPEEVSKEIIKGAIVQSATLSLFRRVTMSRKQQRMPVESVLPIAYWVDGDTGLKQTSEHNWKNKYLTAEELAVIIPIPTAVLDDAEQPIWEEVRPRAEEAIGRSLDAAVFFGIDAPASFPDAIVDAAIAAGNTVTEGHPASEGGIAADISDMFATVEDDGFDVNGVIAVRRMRGKLRNVRDANGVRLAEVSPDEVYGVKVSYPLRGLWPTGGEVAEMVGGDFTAGIAGVRQDIAWRILDQAVIQDGSGAIVFNLAQQDMVALRMTARFGFQVPNPVTHDQPEEDDRYPFGVLLTPES